MQASNDVEPEYAFNAGGLNAINLRGGLGFVAYDLKRIELLYTAQFRRTNVASDFRFNQNTLRLDIKIGQDWAEGRLITEDLEPMRHAIICLSGLTVQ